MSGTTIAAMTARSPALASLAVSRRGRGDRPNEHRSEVAPVRFGRNGVAGEDGDHDDEQEPTQEEERRDAEVHAGLRGEERVRILGRRRRPGRRVRLQRDREDHRDQHEHAERDVGPRSPPLLHHLRTEQREHHPESASMSPRKASSRRCRERHGVDVEAVFHQRANERGADQAVELHGESVTFGLDGADTRERDEEGRGAPDVVDLDIRRRRGVRELRDRPRADDPTSVHHHDLITDLLDFREQVCRQEDRDPDVGHALEQRADLPHLAGIEAVGGFVEHEGFRLTQQGPRDAESLPHPLGVGLHLSVHRVAEPGDTQGAVEVRAREVAAPRLPVQAKVDETRAGTARTPRVRSSSRLGRGRRSPVGSRRRGSAPVPEVGRTRPTSIRKVVVFPAPFGPNSPHTDPRRTVKSTWSTAVLPHRTSS